MVGSSLRDPGAPGPGIVPRRPRKSEFLARYGTSPEDFHAAHAPLTRAIFLGALAALLTGATAALPLAISAGIAWVTRLLGVTKKLYAPRPPISWWPIALELLPDVLLVIMYGSLMALIRRWAAFHQKYVVQYLVLEAEIGSLHGPLRVGPEDAAGIFLGVILIWAMLAIHDAELLGWWFAYFWWVPGLLITSIWLSIYDRLVQLAPVPPEAALSASIRQQLRHDHELARLITPEDISFHVAQRSMKIMIRRPGPVSQRVIWSVVRKIRHNSDVSQHIDTATITTRDATYQVTLSDHP